MRAYVEAYGCTLNMGESREIRDLLADRGWRIVTSPADADLSVLATCVVVEKTEREMLRRIKALSSSPRLIITGCMATACREKAEAIAPNAEFVGPADLEAMARIVEPADEQCSSPLAPDAYAIVPIATGCLGGCSYCITRLARGPLRSRPLDAIVRRVAAVTSRGPIEVQLTAQDTAAYGSDLGSNLPELVDQVCHLSMDFRVRVGMMNPRSALAHLEGIVEMYHQPKVFKFLHLPVQSGSDTLLTDMSRGYTVDDFKRTVRAVREAAPGMSLSTDLIVGYPGETDDDHARNMKLISDVKPDIVNVTRFSPRSGTAAASLSDQVAGYKAKDRSRELGILRFSVALSKNKSFIGSTFRALSTEPGKSNSTILRTDEYRQVVVKAKLGLGKWFTVRIVNATPTYLVGEAVGPG